jgi:hypothetical protein
MYSLQTEESTFRIVLSFKNMSAEVNIPLQLLTLTRIGRIANSRVHAKEVIGVVRQKNFIFSSEIAHDLSQI